MAATATPETKTKAPKAIVTTKVTAEGVVNELAKSSHAQLDRSYELVALLCKVPAWADKATDALEPLGALIDATRPKD